MKAVSLLILYLLFCSINFTTAQLKSKVDERFELTSIVFRLADAPEYVNNEIPTYTNAIDNYFKQYKKHELILFIKEIREKHGISYDAVTIAASCLHIKNGKITIKPGFDISRISELDSRWTASTFQLFVNQLNRFYKETKFNHFYSQHKDLYNTATDRLDELLKQIDYHWFKSYFGSDLEEASVIASLSNGPSNYAFSTPPKNGIVIGCATDEKGLPLYNKNMILVIVHELLHHYTNPLIFKYKEQMDSSALKIYSYSKEDMNKLAYGDAHIAISEWFTNLFSILYFQENPGLGLSFSVDHLIRESHNQGFIWMERSMIFMQHFLDNRNQYSLIEDFIPQIIGFLNLTAENFEQVQHEYNNRRPYVVDFFPIPGSTVTPDITTIKIRFSEPMLEANGIKAMDDENILIFPYFEMPFWQDKYTFVIPLDKTKLINGKTYGGQLIRDFFQSDKTYAMQKDYIYFFSISE